MQQEIIVYWAKQKYQEVHNSPPPHQAKTLRTTRTHVVSSNIDFFSFVKRGAKQGGHVMKILNFSANQCKYITVA